MKIIPLREGSFTVDRSKNFVPFNVDTDDLQSRAKGSLLVEIQPFVVITSSDILLLDTGLGFTSPDGTMQIHEILSEHNISSTDITKVLISHLHKDHSGGILMPDKKTAAFPDATYFINKNEWELASKGSSSYSPEDFLNLRQVQLTEGNGNIGPTIRYIFTGGHSPFHQAFEITENGETIFFGGDVASQSQQMSIRYKAKYDYDPDTAMNLRTQWGEEGRKNGWTFLFYHDIKYPTRRL